MIKIQVNDEEPVLVEKITPEGISLDGSDQAIDIKKVGENEFHLIYKGRSFSVLVNESGEKEYELSFPDKKLKARVIEELDEVLEKMGMGGASSDIVKEVKAPMPGVILEVKVNGSADIKKGDPLVVLEAMKMENVIKSPVDATIKDVLVQKGDKVEKNAILVAFDDTQK